MESNEIKGKLNQNEWIFVGDVLEWINSMKTLTLTFSIFRNLFSEDDFA